MIYSLARRRTQTPKPPFRLGGTYLGRPGAHFISDAFESHGLNGSEAIFYGLSDGDLIVVDVESIREDGALGLSQLSVSVKSEGGLRTPVRPHAARFAEFVNRVRAFFTSRGLRETFTPTLVTCPGLEPSLEPFKVDHRFLPTSPEVHLKKALVAGWHDIFELKSCFRREDASPHHASEFVMLEWYRAFADLGMIADDLRALIATLAAEGWFGAIEMRETDFARLFHELFEFELVPHTTIEHLISLCARLGVETAPTDSFNDLFHRVLIAHVEPALARWGPTLVRGFPPSMAALAKFDREGWADRFEFYWNGLEIANAFNEVNDPDEQARRWELERAERRHLGTSEVPTDPELIAALRRGLPPTGGIALGVERLYMAGSGVKDIRELRLFSR